MPSGSQDDRTLARRLKHGVATTVRSMPKGFRERVANLVLPADERPATGQEMQPADVGQTGAESWHVLADPEGNEFCLLRSRVAPVG